MRTPKGLPTASRLQLAMTCAASQVLEVVDSEYAAGEAGREKHHALAALVGEGTALVASDYSEATVQWIRDMEEANFTVLQGAVAEPAYAFDVNTRAVRFIGRDVKWVYNQSPSEVAGAMDFVKTAEDMVIVADLKTGMGETAHPARNHQLRFGALAAARIAGVDRARIGLLLAPEGRAPRWQWSELDAFGLEEVELDLVRMADRIGWAREAVAKGKVPHLTVGEHCNNCKARHGCPARVAMAKRLVGEPEEVVMDLKMMLTPESASIALNRFRAATGAMKEVAAALYAYAAETPISLGNGMVWGPKTKEREVIDAEAAWSVLVENYGPEIAKAAMTLETSKAGVDRAMHEMREKLRGWPVETPRPPGVPAGKVTLKGLNEKALELLREGKAVTKKEVTEYDEYPVAPPRLAE